VPRYQYRCDFCEKECTINHLSAEIATVCPLCDKEGHMTKVITRFRTPSKHKQKKKKGDLTEEFIQDARTDLHVQKKELLKKR